jgi:regulator of protease activity HflC (stomatin/prohibitin superfamily)
MKRSRRNLSRRKRRKRSGLGEYRWLIAVIILSLFAYLLDDSLGVGYGFLGSYIWLAAFVFSFFLGIFYFSQFILPLDWKESWFEGMRLSLVYNFPLVGRLLGVQAYKRKGTADKHALETLPSSLINHGAGLIKSHLALILTKGIIITRSTGPGFVRLNKAENIGLTVDLREQRRKGNVRAMTRDGIPVESEISVSFRVKREQPPGEPGLPYPYEPNALFQISYVDSLREKDTPLDWTRQISHSAENSLISELSRFTLDELYQLEQISGRTPLEQVKQTVLSDIAARFDRHGIEVTDFTFGHLKPPDRIVEQKIINWQADWQSRMHIQEAEGDARIMRRLRFARARAQVEIIDNIAKNIDNMRRNQESDLKDIVAYRMIEAMEKAISDETVQELVPENTRSNLARFERWLQRYPGYGSDSKTRGRQEI